MMDLLSANPRRRRGDQVAIISRGRVGRDHSKEVVPRARSITSPREKIVTRARGLRS